MAVLSRAVALACLTACYSPDVRDCSVTCASSTDCAGAQVCGADHFCAMPEVAGTCARHQAGPDAGDDAPGPAPDGGVTPPVDAPVTPVDAAMPDASPFVELHLQVMGHGQLNAAGHTCSGDCTYQVLPLPTDVVAIGSDDQVLEKWTAGPCAGSHVAICTVIPPVTVGAKFHKEHGH
jgi:hypothetical protein